MKIGIIYGLVGLVVIAFSAAAFALKRVEDTAAKNKEAIAFICTTTTALDALVLDAKGSIQRSFDNGTYDRLVRQGILTVEDVARAKQSLSIYNRQHFLLQGRGSKCTT